MPQLSTPRLLLRELHPDDHGGVHAFAADPAVTRHTDWGPNTPEDTAAFLAEAVRDAGARPRRRYTLAVVERDRGMIAGSAELFVVSPAHRRGELGYALARRCWGRGYATEAARALLAFGFGPLGLHKISATCDPDNLGSARVLAKVGMAREGYLRDQLLVRGVWRDRLLFAAFAAPAG